MSRLPVFLSCLAFSLVALAAPEAEAFNNRERCLDAKHKSAAKDAKCRVKAASKALKKGEAADVSRCDSKLTDDFAKADTKFPSGCIGTGDASAIQAQNEGLVIALAALVATPTPAPEEKDAVRCATSKLKSAVKYADCGTKAKRKELRGEPFTRDISRCDDKILDDFLKAEGKGGPSCPSADDAVDVAGASETWFGEVEADLAALDTDSFAGNGPFNAGRRTITFVDTSRTTMENNGAPELAERTLETTIWYPTTSTSATGPLATESGPFPLIIRAHGFSGFSEDSTVLTKHLAGYGYIVVAPSFPLSNLNAPGGATLFDIAEQVGDVSYLIDQMIAKSATPGDFFEGQVDGTRIGALGHSLGGATVLGAGYHVDLGDPRIGAVIGHAPLACVLEETFFDGGDAPLMIIGGTGDLVTGYLSNHLGPYLVADPEKYLVTLEDGLHIGFTNDFLNNDSLNADEAIGCPAVIPPGAERPVDPDYNLPIDFLGGAAAGIDTTAASCEAICPLPGPTFMLHDRQNDLARAATVAMFDATLRGDTSGRRLITGGIDSDNADVTLAFEP